MTTATDKTWKPSTRDLVEGWVATNPGRLPGSTAVTRELGLPVSRTSEVGRVMNAMGLPSHNVSRPGAERMGGRRKAATPDSVRPAPVRGPADNGAADRREAGETKAMVAKYLAEHPGEEFTAKALAELLNLKIKTVERAVRQLLGNYQQGQPRRAPAAGETNGAAPVPAVRPKVKPRPAARTAPQPDGNGAVLAGLTVAGTPIVRDGQGRLFEVAIELRPL